MEYRIVIAIIRRSALPAVEARLVEMHISGLTVSSVKGFGEYTDFFARDWTVEHVKLEIFVRRDQADTVASAIVECSHSGIAGDGLVAVLPVESLTRIRTTASAALDDLTVK